ncbi:hypothetical protein N7478_000479 [Penicillium angulare]|uniref:uncharacterized protein n=1 Tax=Penicillium angulare TaxID=116970 RepID=UPI0025423CF2|nr:uncharacterized protein N7478_000479 [Penicillium angulare]KAJ5291228.1 hypothetical protein N7478_000479 [Penicillium angulare]
MSSISHQDIQPTPNLRIEIFTSTELLTQPWLPKLTQMVNKSYLVNRNSAIKPLSNKVRLSSDAQLSKELGAEGFTAIAFSNTETGETDIIGTASIKEWKDDDLWTLIPFNISTEEGELNDENNQTFDKLDRAGEYELSVVTLLPGKHRGKGLAGLLVKNCYEELLRRERAKVGNNLNRRAVPVMIRTSRENNGAYWLKQGFVPVGGRLCPRGFWDAADEFTMWAMRREVLLL